MTSTLRIAALIGLVGRLVSKDIEKGIFLVLVDAVPRVWQGSKAEDPMSIVGKTVEATGVFGEFLDLLVVMRTGETIEFECKHDGDRLRFPGELLRKVAPFITENYPVAFSRCGLKPNSWN